MTIAFWQVKETTVGLYEYFMLVLHGRSLSLCPTLCNPMDCSPPDSSVHGIFQARILEKVAISFSMLVLAAAAAKSLQSCPTLCDPIDSSPPGSPIPGILQARTLEWVAISFSSAWKWKVKVKLLSRVRLLATPWTAAYRLLHPWDFPGKSTGVGCHCFFQQRAYSLKKTWCWERLRAGREESRATEDEMFGWQHWLNGHEFEQSPGDSEGQGSLVCCSPWGHKISTWFSD